MSAFRSLALGAMTLAMVVAGCTSPNGPATPPSTSPATAPSTAPTTAPHDAMDHGTANVSGTPSSAPAAELVPAPRGTALTTSSIQTLAAAFNDEPLTGGQQPWPGHKVKWVNNNTFLILHFDNDDVSKATKLLWAGIGVRSVFCAETQPGGSTGGFTHFHSLSAPTYPQGHGGTKGQQGYWLLHIAVQNFTAPWGNVTTGVDYNFGLTPPPTCGTVPPVNWSSANVTVTPFTSTQTQALAAVLNDNVLSSGQTPWPGHLTKWVTPETFVLAHFDNDDVSKATKLLWFGIGTRGEFCKQNQPSPDYTHFHRYEAPNYPAGHGGSPHTQGYWLLHLAVDNFHAPWGDVSPGIDRNFGVTPPPTC